jgi:hypothetical protein
MEILRVPPYPISTVWTVPDSSTTYQVYVEDLADHSSKTVFLTSNSNSKITYTLTEDDLKYDRSLIIRIFTLNNHMVLDDTIDVIRPYVDPSTLGTTASEIEEYKTLEMVARSIIDTVITDGFYNKKVVLEGVGNGADYFPLWNTANKILKIYQNSEMVYDNEVKTVYSTWGTETENQDLGLYIHPEGENHGYNVGDSVYVTLPDAEIDGYFTVTELLSGEDGYGIRINTQIDGSEVSWDSPIGTVQRVWNFVYQISLDNSAIFRAESGMYNRYNQAPIYISQASSDIDPISYRSGAFPNGDDFVFVLDSGYKTLPTDVEYATKLLIEDLKCGKLDYYKRYVTSYSTDQYRIQFDKAILDGTGNLIVDKILDKYSKTITRPGII